MEHVRGVERDGLGDLLNILLEGGVLRLGRCVPNLCTDQDIEIGFRNFLHNASADLPAPTQELF